MRGPPRTRQYLEAMARFSLSAMRPALKLPGASATVTWPSGAKLHVVVEADTLDVAYHPADGGPSVRDRVHLEHFPQSFGGAETFALCPVCGTRRRVLYVVAGRLRCSDCTGADYVGRSLAPEHRLLRKHRKLREKISPDARHLPPGVIPPRPPWMFRRVYRRLVQEAMAPWQARQALVLPRLGAAVAELRKRYGLDEADVAGASPRDDGAGGP